MWALLTLYQALRMAMVDTVESVLGVDPGLASCTVALQAARDQLICVDHVLLTPSNGTGHGISIAVPSALLPTRRSRTSARKVKCPTPRYPANPSSEYQLAGQKVARLAVEIHTEPPSSRARQLLCPAGPLDTRRPPRSDRKREVSLGSSVPVSVVVAEGASHKSSVRARRLETCWRTTDHCDARSAPISVWPRAWRTRSVSGLHVVLWLSTS